MRYRIDRKSWEGAREVYCFPQKINNIYIRNRSYCVLSSLIELRIRFGFDPIITAVRVPFTNKDFPNPI